VVLVAKQSGHVVLLALPRRRSATIVYQPDFGEYSHQRCAGNNVVHVFLTGLRKRRYGVE
jgi:hypothetical protein